MYNENMIEMVREYLNDHNDVAIKCLEHLVDYDWLTIYSLDDLLDDYCDGDLEEVINLFVSSGTEARAYCEYYVRDGEVYDADDLYYDIESVLYDDDVITEIIAEIDYGNVNVPDGLYEMCHVTDWEQVSEYIGDGYISCAKTCCDNVHEGTAEGLSWFIVHSLDFATIYRVYDCLMNNEGFAKSADDLELLKGMAWDNTLVSIADFAKKFAVGGVTIEKATEVWIKKNVLEG